MDKEKKILQFEKEGLVGLHFFVNKLRFPIAIATYSEWDEQQVMYLYSSYEQKGMTSKDLCLWCIRHKVKYQIMYPLEKIPMLKNPLKYMEYLKSKRQIASTLKY